MLICSPVRPGAGGWGKLTDLGSSAQGKFTLLGDKTAGRRWVEESSLGRPTAGDSTAVPQGNMAIVALAGSKSRAPLRRCCC